MYDEFVKRLRCQHFGNCQNCPMWYTEEVEPNLWRVRCVAIDAADAIEELSKQHEQQRQNLIALMNEKPRWISVEERMPKETGRYLVRYKRDIVLDYTEVHNDEVRIMRYFVGNGWRYPFLCQPELRKAEQQTVTHWMALPILPVEENEND